MSKSRNNKQGDKGFDPKMKDCDKQTQQGDNPKFKDKKKGPKGKGRNPIEIWNKHPDLTKAAGTLAYAQSLGQPIDWDAAGGEFTNPVGAGMTSVTSPGLMGIMVALTYGTSKDKGSALNIAGRNSYTFIRHQNSGHTNYDNTTLMSYYIAVDNMFALHSWCRRIYGTLLNYKVLNRYTPDDLLAIQGVDAGSFRANMAQFKFYLDQWAVRLQSFLVPDTMPIFKRHYDMFANYYLDSENIQVAQLYVEYPGKLFYWDDAANAVDEHFKPVLDIRPEFKFKSYDSGGHYNLSSNNPLFGNLLTMNDFVNAMETMLQSVATTEDFNIISGDILKAYGAEHTWAVPITESNYYVEPVFNWEMLVQIHNLNTVECPKFGFDSSYTPSTDIQNWVQMINDRTFRPTEIVDPISMDSWISMFVCGFSHMQHPVVTSAKLLDVPFKDPTPEDNMEATRLMIAGGKLKKLTPFLTLDGKELLYMEVPSFGTEVVLYVSYGQRSYRHLTAHGDYTFNVLMKGLTHQGVIADQMNAGDARMIGEMAKFTLAPIKYAFWDLENTLYTQWDSNLTAENEISLPGFTIYVNDFISGFIYGVLGDLDHHTVVSNDVISKLHTVAVLSVFNIPEGALKG